MSYVTVLTTFHEAYAAFDVSQDRGRLPESRPLRLAVTHARAEISFTPTGLTLYLQDGDRSMACQDLPVQREIPESPFTCDLNLRPGTQTFGLRTRQTIRNCERRTLAGRRAVNHSIGRSHRRAHDCAADGHS